MRKIISIIVLFTISMSLFSQSDSIFKLTQLKDEKNKNNNEPGIALNHCWKYHKGDSMDWMKPSFNDKNWKYIQTEIDLSTLPEGTFENCGWFRLHIEVDTELVNKPIILMLNQTGASEIYLDGNLLHKYGKIDEKNILNDELIIPQYSPIHIVFAGKRNHVIAVRYRNRDGLKKFMNGQNTMAGFDMRLSDLETTFDYFNTGLFAYKGSMIFYFTFFVALSILHFLLFIFYRKNKSNLYYSIFAFSFGLVFFNIFVLQVSTNAEIINKINHIKQYIGFIYCSALFAMLYNIFYKKIPKLFWVWIALIILKILTIELAFESNIIKILYYSFIFVEPIRIIIHSIYKKKDGAWIIGSGVITTIIFFTVFSFIFISGNSELLFKQTGMTALFLWSFVLLCTISIPLTMSAYLALEFSRTNKNLENKLIEVESLSLKSIEQEKEKQQILAEQNTNLEKQVKLRTHEVVEQKKIIEEKNKDITDSISYAKRIQDATLPSKELKYKLFPDAFVLFKPKDIVSGDFYWFAEINDIKFIAAADCTGHGVPGAMVSVVCSNALNRAVKEFGETEPGKILDRAREIVLESFSTQHNNLNDEGVKDGMDISLISIPKTNNPEKITIKWSGANNPIWYIKNNALNEITANKQPIGRTDNPLPFTTHIFEVSKGDTIYLFSDGYADQFGGIKGKKFKYKQLSDLLISIHYLPMIEQETILDKTFDDWKANLEQVDDVLVIGVKV